MLAGVDGPFNSMSVKKMQKQNAEKPSPNKILKIYIPKKIPVAKKT